MSNWNFSCNNIIITTTESNVDVVDVAVDSGFENIDISITFC